MKYILIMVGVVVLALVSWALFVNNALVMIILKIVFGILVVLVVCAILGAVGINPFDPKQRKL